MDGTLARPPWGWFGMRRPLRSFALLCTLAAPAGCRTTTTEPVTEAPPPAARQAPDLKPVRPASLEPDTKTLTALDAMAAQPRPIFGDGAGEFRQLTREQCRALAVQNAVTAALLEQENAVPDCPPGRGRVPDPCRESAASVLKRLRELA